MSDKLPELDTIQPDDCCIQAEDGSYALVIRLMPEQLAKFQAWANHLGVPLDRFMRECTDVSCTQLAQDLAIARHEQAVADATLTDGHQLLLH